MFEVFDHTADLGLRIRAADLNTLFSEAGRAFLSVLVSNPDAIEPRDAIEVNRRGTESRLPVSRLDQRLLFLLESKKFLASRFDASGCRGRSSRDRPRGTVRSARHMLAHEVKAVTYHGLKVEPTESGWLAEVILDI